MIVAKITRKRTSIWIEADDPGLTWDVHQEDGTMVCIEGVAADGDDIEIFIDRSLFPQIQSVIDRLEEERG